MFGGHALADTSVTVDVTVQPTRSYCHTARNDETTREVGILLLNTNWSYPSLICSNPSNSSVARAKVAKRHQRQSCHLLWMPQTYEEQGP
jgi:hypothetical protein